ncbi:MAG: hypothetical protein WA051_02180, partial [Minisyncoccia bacterium]
MSFFKNPGDWWANTPVNRKLSLVFLVAGILVGFFVPGKAAHSQSVRVSMPKGTSVEVFVTNSDCKCIKPDSTKKVPAKVAAKPKPSASSRALAVGRLKASADSLQLAMRVAALSDSLRKMSARGNRVGGLRMSVLPMVYDFRLHLPDTLVVKHIGIAAVPEPKKVEAKGRDWRPVVITAILGSVVAYCAHENCFGKSRSEMRTTTCTTQACTG